MIIKTYYIALFGFLIVSCNSEKTDLSNKVENPIEEITKEEPEFVIVKEFPMEEWGGTQPELTLRQSGIAYLITEVPPFFDGDGNELFDDEDFPEGLEFEKLITEYIGTEVLRDDREVFIIENATDKQCEKVVEFFVNYWDNRKDEYKIQN